MECVVDAIQASTAADVSCDNPFSEAIQGACLQHDVDEVSAEHLTCKKEDLSEQLKDFDIQRQDFLEMVRRFLEARSKSGSRPLPVLLGGREVDLFQLSLQVRICEGYDGATAKCMWSFVAEKLGFGLECGPGLKLVYFKYLNSFESSREVINGLSSGSRMSLRASKFTESNLQNIGQGKQFSVRNVHENVTFKEKEGSLGKGGGTGKQTSALHHDVIIGENPTKRRKQVKSAHENLLEITDKQRSALMVTGGESLEKMLEWIKRLALNPGDCKLGQGPRGSKKNEKWVEKRVTQWNRIRDLIWRKKNISGSTHKNSPLRVVGLSM